MKGRNTTKKERNRGIGRQMERKRGIKRQKRFYIKNTDLYVKPSPANAAYIKVTTKEREDRSMA